MGTPTVSDNCTDSGNITVWNNVSYQISYYGGYPIGITTITWWAEDEAGNRSSTTQTVTVTDDDAPIISCPGSICRQVDNGQTYYTVNGHEFDLYWVWDCSDIASRTYSIDGGAPVTANTLAGVQFTEGNYTVTWTVTDNAGNPSSCTINVTINSNDPPSVTCRGNATKSTDSGVCTYTVQGTEFDVTSTTPGTTLTYTLTGVTTGTGSSLADVVLNKGATTVTWTATNGTEDNDCCTFSVTVYDNEDPSITWPANITVNVDEGGCTATGVSLGSPSGTDNCTEDVNISYSQSTSATTFSIGVTNVYWYAEDEAGNTTSHTQTVTVTDNIPPVIACPATTYYREFDNSSVSYYTVDGSEFRPDRSDNCEIKSYTNNISGWTNTTLSGYHLTLGDHAIVWTATDWNTPTPNSTQCTVNVTIVDSFEPILDCPDNTTVYSPTDGCNYTFSDNSLDPAWLNLSVIDGRTLTHNIQTTNSAAVPYAPSATTLNGAIFPAGETTVTWTASQIINGTTYTSNCTYTVTVRDNIAPVVTGGAAHFSVSVDDGTCLSTVALTPPTATDNCTASGALTITSDAALVRPFLVGVNRVRWTIADASGNVTTHDQLITVVDDEGPVITGCNTPEPVQASGANCEAVVSWPPLVATDACSGVKSFTSSHSPGQLFPVGTTVVTYTAIDNADNESTCTFNVEVTDVAPTVSCVGDQTRNTNPGVCSYKVLGNEFDPTDFDDNCVV